MDDAGAVAREAAEAATAEKATERLTFFSDAVIAIAITLLAIELPLPEVSSIESLVESWHANAYEYGAFLISFGVIGNHWSIHHGIFRYVGRSDGRVVRLNLAWLLVIVLTPFLTKIAAEGHGLLSFAFYAVPQALQTLLMAWLIHEIGQRGWFAPHAPRALVRGGYLRSLYFAAGFLVSVPAYLLIGSWAFLIWWLVPVGLGLVTRRVVDRAA